MNQAVRHIGIVGCSAEGAALCYRTICAEGAHLLGRHAHPEVSMHTHALARYVGCLERSDLRGVSDLMLSSATKLAGTGADFLICPDNTIHEAFPYVEERSPLPWLHIADVVASAAAQNGYRRLALLGTRRLVESDVYPKALALHEIECVPPNEVERAEIDRIIFDELVCAIFKADSVSYHQRTIRRLKDLGCDAVVLGCTEIPLIINADNSVLPVLDSTHLLARAALRESIEGTP